MIMSDRVQIRGNSNNPYHLSIGGILLNEGKVFLIKKPDGKITLPRETAYSNESVHDTLIRGFIEELGINIIVLKFLGSLKTHFNRPDGTDIEKTTLYFLVEHKSDTTKNQADDEIDDEVIELELQEAIKVLTKQDNEEYLILQRI